MFNEPIKSMKQAKEFFIAMNGSPFHMAREFPKRYDEYKSLNITKQTKCEWREELLINQLDTIEKTDDTELLWITFTSMYDLFADLKTEAALETMLAAATYLQSKLKIGNESAIVAETILGNRARSTRQGLVYMSYDMGNISAAKEFIKLALHFSTYDGSDQFAVKRCQEARDLGKDIQAELGL